MDRKANETAAPSAKPRDRKKAMMAPAVSASCFSTFLYGDTRGTKLITRYSLIIEHQQWNVELVTELNKNLLCMHYFHTDLTHTYFSFSIHWVV